MENRLAVIVKESQLEPTKAKYILDQFKDYFEIAAEWETKAKAIVVTKETQKPEMEMARVGRLFLREKRIAIEKARKELKEQALREGKAIDGIANILKALIIPIEDYLGQQEKFVEIQEENKREAKRLEIEQRMEEERLAKEKEDTEALEKARLENEKLRAEAAEREKKIIAERKEQEEIRKRDWEKTEMARRNHEKKLAIERTKAREAAEEAAVELKAVEEKARVAKKKERVKAEAERKEKECLAEILRNQIVCPKCGNKFQLKKEKK